MNEKLELEIKVNNAQSKQALKETNGLLDDLAQGAKQGLGLASGLVAMETVGRLARGVGEFVTMAMEAEAIQADLQATLLSTKGAAGVTADEINRMAQSLGEVTKYEDDTIVQGQAMLLTFTNIGKDVFPDATEAMLDMAQKFKYDLPQAAIVLGKALNDPIAGVGALRRIGVQLTDEQKDLIDGFMAVGDVASAQKIILGELKTELGGVARAYGETTPGAIDIFNNKIANTKEAIGAGLLPVINDLLGSVQDLTGGVTGNNQAWTDITATLATFMASPLSATLANTVDVMRGLNEVTGVFKGLLNDLGIGVKGTAGELNLWNVALNALVSALKTLTGGPLVWFKSALDGIRDVIREIKALNLNSILADLHNLGIPGFASGGIVPGRLGAPMLAVVHGGEQIIPAGNTNNWNLTINSRAQTEQVANSFYMMQYLARAYQ